jgi:hypothetical protein
MADKVHADAAAIIDYAGKLGGMGGSRDGKATSPAIIGLNATMPLNQMGEVLFQSFTRGTEVIQEAKLVAGYILDNIASFKQFIPDCTEGIQCCAMQAQGVGLILSYTDGSSAGEISAEDVNNALAYASGDPSAQRPDGLPKDQLKDGTWQDAQSKAESGPQQAMAITDPNSQFAKNDPHEPGSNDTITRYLDGSYRVVTSYPTYENGKTGVHTETRYYTEGGKAIPNTGQVEDDTYGQQQETITRHEGDTTVSTTRHKDGSVEITTKTKDAKGDTHTTTTRTEASDTTSTADKGPIQTWEQDGHAPDGSQGAVNIYGGY